MKRFNPLETYYFIEDRYTAKLENGSWEPYGCDDEFCLHAVSSPWLLIEARKSDHVMVQIEENGNITTNGIS